MLNTTSQNRLGMYCQSFIKHSRGNANNCLSFVNSTFHYLVLNNISNLLYFFDNVTLDLLKIKILDFFKKKKKKKYIYFQN